MHSSGRNERSSESTEFDSSVSAETQILNQGGAPTKLTLQQRFEAYYGINEAEPKVSREKYAKQWGVNGSTITRNTLKLAQEMQTDSTIHDAYEKWKTEQSSPKFFWKEEPDSNNPDRMRFISPYETVQTFINERRGDLEGLRDVLNHCERFWSFVGKKDPKLWTKSDWSGFLQEKTLVYNRKTYLLTDSTRFGYSVAVRYVAPQLKDYYGMTKKLKQALKKHRIKIQAFIEEFRYVMKSSKLTDFDKLFHLTHVTLGSREGYDPKKEASILFANWNRLKWSSKTIDIFESKTGGGFFWEDCPLDLFGEEFDLVGRLRRYWIEKGKPTEGRIFEITPKELSEMYRRITQVYFEFKAPSEYGVKTIRPHYSRKIHVNICANDMGLPLELVAGEAPKGTCGVGWEDLTTLKSYYLSLKEGRTQRRIELAKKRLRGEELSKEELLELGIGA